MIDRFAEYLIREIHPQFRLGTEELRTIMGGKARSDSTVGSRAIEHLSRVDAGMYRLQVVLSVVVGVVVGLLTLGLLVFIRSVFGGGA